MCDSGTEERRKEELIFFEFSGLLLRQSGFMYKHSRTTTALSVKVSDNEKGKIDEDERKKERRKRKRGGEKRGGAREREETEGERRGREEREKNTR